MSMEATRWAWKQECGRATSKLVLLSLADRAGKDRTCYPSIQRLEQDTECDRKTVMSALRSLEEAGLIAAVRSPGRATVYALNVNQAVPKTALVPVPDLVPVPKTGPVPISVQDQYQKRDHTSTKNGTRTYQEPTKNQKEDKNPPTPTGGVTRISLPAEFVRLREIYPDRAGDQNWRRALHACQARIAEGHSWADILDGAERYARFIEATGKLGTEYVKQAATFCGPDKAFLNPWIPPPSKAESRTATNLAGITEWLNS